MLRGLPLAEDQHVVQALAAQRANRPVYEFARGDPPICAFRAVIG
jgi:hypothetical protein